MIEREKAIIAHGKHRFKQKWNVTENYSVKQKALNFLADCTYLTYTYILCQMFVRITTSTTTKTTTTTRTRTTTTTKQLQKQSYFRLKCFLITF